MKKFFKKLSKFVRKPIVLIGIVVLAVFLFIAMRPNDPLSGYQTASIERTNVVQEVDVTGRVEAAQEIELSIERSGVVSYVGPEVGDRVSSGSIIVSTRSGTLSAQSTEALAALRQAELELSTLENIPAESAVGTAVQTATTGLRDQIVQSRLELDNTLATYVDQLFSNPRTNPSFGASYSSGNITIFISGVPRENIEINSTRRALNNQLESWQLSSSGASEQDLLSSFRDGEQALLIAQDLFSSIALVIADRNSGDTAERAVLDSARADIYTARTSAISSLSSLRASYDEYQASQSSVGEFEINFAKIRVEQARARLAATQAQLAETVIRSPIDGVVTRQDAKVGQIAPAGVNLVTVISDAKFKIEALVPEADITKIELEDIARVTLDSYGEREVLEARVITIDPAETIQDGVATYEITLEFTKGEELALPGMTANIDILTGEQKNVLAIPQRSVITRGTDAFVRVVVGNEIQERQIQTGLRGTDGNFEVISGLNEGDTVVVSSPEN